MCLVVLPNGECQLTASEDLTIKQACQKSNRFIDIKYDLYNTRLEYYYTNAQHQKEKVRTLF